MLLYPPRLGPPKVSLRPYQAEAINAIREEFRRGKRSTLLVLPTGTGKTVTFGMASRLTMEKGGRVLVLAHRGELIEQTSSTFDLLGIEAGIEKAGSYARSLYEPDCVIATVQTLQRDRLQSWDRNHFNLLVTDEAHHATADSYQKIYKHFSRARHLGVTATADRADEDELSDVFESVAYELSLWDAMRATPPGPYLSRLLFVQCDVQIDLRDIRTTGGDFNQADLEERIRPLVDVLSNAIRQEVGARQTLVFTPDVGSSQAIATALGSLGLRADWVSGDDRDRKVKIERYRSGEIQILCNCALLTEGFDAPATSAIVLCRPTKSRALYAQMVGRGTRLAPEKENCLIVDFDYLTQRHKLCNPIDLFDTTHTDPEIIALAEEALTLKTKNQRQDLAEAIEKAEKEHKERQVLRIRAREREVKYRKVCYDPAATCETLGLAWRGRSPDAVAKMATQGQVDALRRFKVDGAERISKTKASTLLDYLVSRSKAGLATHKQVAWMIARGVDPEVARAKTFEEASATLDQLFSCRP